MRTAGKKDFGVKRLSTNAPTYSIHSTSYGTWSIRMRWNRGRHGLVYVSTHKTRKEAEAEVRRLEQGDTFDIDEGKKGGTKG
jgi:hypothetical protein